MRARPQHEGLGGDGPPDALAHLFGNRQVGTGQHHHEFLAARSAGQVDAPYRAADAPCHLLQHAVARVVAIGVVDRLEEVDVERQQRQALAAIRRLFDQLQQLGFEVAAVVEAGERVGDGHLHRGAHGEAQLLGIAVAADLGGDAGQQFLPVDRTDQVIVDAHVERPQQALVVIGIDKDQDRRLAGRFHRLELRADAQAVDALEVEVDDDQVIATLRRTEGLEGLLRLGHQGHLVLRRQQVADALARRLAIVEDENAPGSSLLRRITCGQAQRVRAGAGAQLVRQHLQPHQPLHAAEQRHIVDGLGEEVIGTRLEATHPVLRLVERGDHDHGNVLGGRVLLDPPAHLDAVDPRHHHVEQHDVGAGALHRLQRVGTIHGGDDLEIFGRELRLEQPDIGEDVVDDEDACRHCGVFR